MNQPGPFSPTARRIGRYDLGRRIGAGGMAAVFAAREHGPIGLGRLVALKVMSPALVGNPAYERLFLREAGITSRIEHAHVVRVYEVGEADGALFIAMEFVRGASLQALSLVAPPPLAIALRVLRETAEALEAAHELKDSEGKPLGLVHQDVSPHNIMVTAEGVTKLLDFGVARIGSLDATRTSTIRGKPSYLAPEQVTGEPTDRRTDVFALGIVMYELLTGQRLFARKSSLAMFNAVVNEPIPCVRDVAAELPKAVAAICDRALQRDPVERFQSAADFASALETACKDEQLTIPTDKELGRWVHETQPLTLDAAELEREIVGGYVPQQLVDPDELADLATEQASALALGTLPLSHHETQPAPQLAVGQETRETGTLDDGPLPSSPPLERRPWGLLAAGLALLAGAGLWFGLGQDGETPHPTTSPGNSSAVAAANQLKPTSSSARQPPPTDGSADPSASNGPADASQPTAPQRSSRPVAPSRQPRVPATAPTPAPPPTSTTPSPPPPATSQPADPPVVEHAVVIVGSNVWGRVIFDGRTEGDSPQSITTTPGSHTATVRLPDGRSKSRGVSIKAGETKRVRFVF